MTMNETVQAATARIFKILTLYERANSFQFEFILPPFVLLLVCLRIFWQKSLEK
jgi:hypothetical protein